MAIRLSTRISNGTRNSFRNVSVGSNQLNQIKKRTAPNRYWILGQVDNTAGAQVHVNDSLASQEAGYF
jgi:hypothetical protein